MDELYDFRAQKALQDGLVAPHKTLEIHPFVNPPFTAVLYAPFAAGGYVVGLAAWWAVGLAALGGSLVLLRRELFLSRAVSIRQLALGAVLFFPTIAWFMYGQNTAVTLLLFTMTYVWLRRGRDFRAGLALGLLFYKPQLMLACGAALLVKGRWSALLGAVAGTGAWLAVGWAVNPETMLQYAGLGPALFDFLRGDSQAFGLHVNYPTWGLHSFFGFSSLLLDGWSRSAADGLAGLLTICGLIAICVAWLRTPWKPGSRQWDLTIAATLAFGLLISPHLFLYDLLLLLLPLIIVWRCCRDEAPGKLLDGGPLLALTALLYAATFVSSYLTKAQMELATALGLAKTGLQFSVPIIVVWSWLVFRAARGQARE
jgi:hypothetical protein